MQVIPYISELLAKVHEQQAQAERIIGFQAHFGCVHAVIAIDAALLPICVKLMTVASFSAPGQLDAIAKMFRLSETQQNIVKELAASSNKQPRHRVS